MARRVEEDALAVFLRGRHDSSLRNTANDGFNSSSDFNVGQRIEALLGTDRELVGGVITKVNNDGTYGIIFDTGHEFAALDGQLLSIELNKIVELETQLAQVYHFSRRFPVFVMFVVDASFD